MFILAWDDKLLTGIDIVDSQHKDIITSINMFNMRSSKKFDLSKTSDLLKALSHYTTVHFQAEESFMSLSNYPNYREHAAIHKQLGFELKKLKVLLSDKEISSDYMMEEIDKFVKELLVNHIGIEDQKFSKHYQAYKRGKADEN